MDNKYFKEALASMAASYAYVDAIKHLYDQGYSPEKIKRNLTYPVSIEKIERVIAEYQEELKKPEAKYEYVQTVDSYGKRSFIRVPKDKA